MSSDLGSISFAGAVVTPAEFQIAVETRRKAKLEKLITAPDRPLTEDDVLALVPYLIVRLRKQLEQIKCLKADNARMQALLAKRSR